MVRIIGYARITAWKKGYVPSGTAATVLVILVVSLAMKESPETWRKALEN